MTITLTNTENIAIIILAAGNSSRMGMPKQNLLIHGQTLLQRMAAVALEISPKVVVVLGANAGDIVPSLRGMDLKLLRNDQWNKGMGTSISQGVKYVQNEFPETESIITLVCDQPFVSVQLLQKLVHASVAFSSGIIASYYDGVNGVPALFRRQFFSALTDLREDEGARKIIKAHKRDVVSIPFGQGLIDLDTPEDYDKLIALRNELPPIFD